MTKNQLLKVGYFNLARVESLKVNFRARIGSVLVRKNRPISIGRNNPRKTHTMSKSKFKTIHAEVDSCIGIDRHLINNSIVYNYRETKDGKLANSKPCDTCVALLKDLGVKKVLYTHEKGYSEIKL